MAPREKTGGLILAGGRSSRFGSPKAQAMLAGVSLANRVAAMLRPHVATLAVARADPVEGLDAERLADPPGAPSGPLAGVLAGLGWATDRELDWLLVAPCDAPLLPDDLAVRLADAASAAGAPLAIAASADGWQPLCGLWRTTQAGDLRAALAGGRHPPVHQFAQQAGVAIAHFDDARRFLNINTPGDLAAAEVLIGR